MSVHRTPLEYGALRFSVIIPVHDGGENFKRCLESLTISTRTPDEIIVVDDASTDSSAAIGSALSARVLGLVGSPRGPAFARNRGVEIATGDILVFFDADVAVHPETLAQIEKYFTEHLELAALFGSYDDAPPARGWVTQYKNLVHHYVHQHSAREASTFWAGCGAIRREVFMALSGFDERYTRPSIEDIELGSRLKRAGCRVWLCPEIQVTHLKRWTFSGLFRSDIFDRAIPWTRLMWRDKQLARDLNLDRRSRVSAILAWALVLCLPLGLMAHGWWIGTLAASAALILVNRDLISFFARHGGILFALSATMLYTLYLLYSSAAFVLVAATFAIPRASRYNR